MPKSIIAEGRQMRAETSAQLRNAEVERPQHELIEETPIETKPEPLWPLMREGWAALWEALFGSRKVPVSNPQPEIPDSRAKAEIVNLPPQGKLPDVNGIIPDGPNVREGVMAEPHDWIDEDDEDFDLGVLSEEEIHSLREEAASSPPRPIDERTMREIGANAPKPEGKPFTPEEIASMFGAKLIGRVSKGHP